jgi:hypothetical protein
MCYTKETKAILTVPVWGGGVGGRDLDGRDVTMVGQLDSSGRNYRRSTVTTDGLV